MIEDHLDLPTLRRFAADELSREALFDAAWHLFLCDACRERLSEVAPEGRKIYDRIFGGQGLTYSELSYSAVTRAVARKLRDTGVEIERQRSQADGLWQELRAHPRSRRLLMVENSGRFQVYGLAEHLLAECRRCWHEDPVAAEEAAELALAVTYRLDRRVHGAHLLNDLKSEAWSSIANCRRIRADLASVAEAFEIARAYRDAGTGDLLQEAEILDLEASLLCDQRRLDEAAVCLERVVQLRRATGDRDAEAAGLHRQAGVAWDRGEEDVATALLERAAGLATPDRDPHLALAVRLDLARFLALAGQADEAAARVPELRRLALSAGDRADRLRLLWIEGTVLAGQGRVELAETTLRRAVAAFARSGAGYDAALVALDLASLLLEAGRSAEARALASDLVPIFAARDVHREALAALAILQNALEREGATLSLVRDLSRFLRRARRNPVLRFERLP